MISSLRGFIGANQMMAYLVMMTARLIELGDSHGLFTTAGSDWHGHRGEPLVEVLSFPPHRLRPFLGEFGLDHLAA